MEASSNIQASVAAEVEIVRQWVTSFLAKLYVVGQDPIAG